LAECRRQRNHRLTALGIGATHFLPSRPPLTGVLITAAMTLWLAARFAYFPLHRSRPNRQSGFLSSATGVFDERFPNTVLYSMMSPQADEMERRVSGEPGRRQFAAHPGGKRDCNAEPQQGKLELHLQGGATHNSIARILTITP